MEKPSLGVLILAAGKGTRMKSVLPKVLHPILDKPMLGYLLSTVLNCVPAAVAVLVGHEGEMICDYLQAFPSVEILWQKEQLGTGHAVRVARDWWTRFDHVLVLNGDLPLLELETLQLFLEKHFESDAACSFFSFVTSSPDGYGRVVRGRNPEEVSIVEHKDAIPEELGICEVNAGCYVFETKSLDRVIEDLKNDNTQKEYYLPEVVSLLNKTGSKVLAEIAKEQEMLGINTQAELSGVTMRVHDILVQKWMARGVRMLDPSAVWIGPDVLLESDVVLMPGAQLWGNTVVGEGCEIGPYCVLRNARLGRRVRLVANVIIEDSELCDNTKAGPFAYIREASLLKKHAFAGKFVELKKTTVGEGSKVPHLSYMGDATLGEGVNIGAGTITCNYDGKNKSPTKIGDRCFVGSDTMLVAPVVLGDDSVTAAGSTITTDVPKGALGVGRARQKNIEGWTSRKNG